jgi:hypothetical protein
LGIVIPVQQSKNHGYRFPQEILAFHCVVEDESAKKGGWAAHCDTSMKFGTDVHWTPAMNFSLGHNLYLTPELIN